MPRHYRLRRRSAPRAIVRTYKKVLNFAPASHAAGTKIDFRVAFGVDSLAVGQTGPTDDAVPTGSIIDYIEFQFGAINLVSASAFMHTSIQNLMSGQSATIAPNVIGGNSQRNQVYHQEMRSIGQNQNATFVYKWKVPKHLRRMREGSALFLTILCTNVWSDTLQVIYKIKQ